MKPINYSKSIMQKAVKATIQKLVNAEVYEWPPLTFCGMYQPHRPEPLPQPKDKK